jgi:hypothetical protein
MGPVARDSALPKVAPQPANSASLRRIGGEIPAFSGRLGPPQPWRPTWLPFSHGRAALAWLIERHVARSAMICAYTCPTVPAFLKARGLIVQAFDVGARFADISHIAKELPEPRMVILPALFGMPPWLDPKAIQSALTSMDLVVIDAAQTAFGHVEFMPPEGGAVLSCPRKTTELADGAVLAVSRTTLGTVADIQHLPVATLAATTKAAARALWATADVGLEEQALAYNRRSEDSWPNTPHRMTDQSLALLERLDRNWHSTTRRRNREALVAALQNRLPIWAVEDGTPFSLPVFVSNREAVITQLRAQRIFATTLWPDAWLDPQRHPAAAWIAKHLVNLPVDQRHDESDMHRIAEAVMASAQVPSIRPPKPLLSFIR